ncbi:hypothetical protein NUH30_19480 [Leptospira sp. 85282-16]|uniref:hypothetical protein n=1 Tax=Leptospira sp. 85282-16 TaxID=2971256 RepID=UPI0021BF92EB|nr:hypothetical protein [Leptospira sp. 85282-16]MCT8335878.1 hypothetical protein [Leptospira sp. 85282-16]
MKIFKSIYELNKSLINLLSFLFRKYPSFLYLFVISLVYFSLLAVSTKQSALLIFSIWVAFFSLLVYIKTKKFSETTFSFFLGLTTVFALDWNEEKATLFAKILFPTLFLYFLIDSLRIAGKNEAILTQAAIFKDLKNSNEVYKELVKIADEPTQFRQINVIERSEIVRFLVFRKFTMENLRTGIEIVEVIKSLYHINLNKSLCYFWAIYNIIKATENRNMTTEDINDTLFLITNIPLSPAEYTDFIITNRSKIIKSEIKILEINEKIANHISFGFDINDLIL